jgi:8-oxo-dGTP pyrophosphatase MutT (NUDIX family)
MKALTRFLYTLNQLRWWITRPLTLGIRLLLIKEDCVLLVKHTYQAMWFLPGGGVEKGETLEQAARREAKEELGAILGDLSLFGMYTNFFDFKSDHVAVFTCTDFTVGNKRSHEIEAVQFFSLENLPGNIAAGHKRRIAEYCKTDKALNFGKW